MSKGIVGITIELSQELTLNVYYVLGSLHTSVYLILATTLRGAALVPI